MSRHGGKDRQEKGSAALNPVYAIRRAGYGLLWIALAAALMGCAAVAEPGKGPAAGPLRGELTIFAAASLTQAFGEMAAAFEQAHPGTAVTVNFDGSQRLRTQLEHGARADLFAAADWVQMNAVRQAGLTAGDPVDFAGNRMVFLVRRDWQPATLQDLAAPGVKIVLALPEAPAGRYSRRVIERMGNHPRFGPEWAAGVAANVVSEEPNVRSVAQKVALGEADAGITYRTDALPAYTAQRVAVLPIPAEVNLTASYPIAALRESAHPELAQAFINFVFSDQGQTILERNGFDPPPYSNADFP